MVLGLITEINSGVGTWVIYGATRKEWWGGGATHCKSEAFTVKYPKAHSAFAANPSKWDFVGRETRMESEDQGKFCVIPKKGSI
jgi:hypothetical protein